MSGAPTLRELKRRAQLLQPVVKVGHEGLSDGLLAALDRALADHGLVKVRFTDHKDERKELARELAARSGSAIVLLVGHTVTLHRPSAAD
jgi:RNA-binding protein